jgi:GT2 family glycosyltransferase/glycosyltransferase involved in cell wall biosynthesis
MAARGWPVLYARLQLDVGAVEISVDPEPVAEDVRIVTLPSWGSERAADSALSAEDARLMAEGFRKLRRQEQIHEAVVFCQSPYWRQLCVLLREMYGWPVVYDRMDLHQGFSSNDGWVVEEENRLIDEADLLTASSEVLAGITGVRAGPALWLPNACDPSHWKGALPSPELENLPRPIVGYFGAISDWFDADLVVGLAIARPEWSFVLVGSTWGADTSRLEVMANVHLLGERSYDELPPLAAAFDVGIIPRRKTPLTAAMDPVKLYEMAACGLEIVASRLPGLESHSDIVRLADDEEAFRSAVEEALTVSYNDPGRARHLAFAHKNTWDQRTEILDNALTELFPKVCIGIVTYNNLELTAQCLDSIERCTVYPNYEVLVVDNASHDGTPAWLEEKAARQSGLRVVLNNENRGFAPACNQAFADTEAEILCFLNNDTVVTQGWLAAMVRALASDRRIGLVGPSSNGVANEARVTPGYEDLEGLPRWAETYVWDHDGDHFSIPMLALYCAALRHEVWDEVGGLDERFEVGLFEDDDFSRRIRQAGYNIVCLRDAWVHHFQEASFATLPKEEYARVYEANRRRFRDKWKGAR